MPLNQEEKQAYIEAVHSIWSSFSHYTADDITEEVAKQVDLVLEEIANCSKSVAVADAAFQAFYAPFSVDKWRQLLLKGAKAVKNWYKKISSNARYKLCINAAARNYRSVVEEALMGL